MRGVRNRRTLGRAGIGGRRRGVQNRQRRIVAGRSHCRFVALAYPYLVGIAEATFSQHQMQRVFFGIDWLM